MLYDKRWDLKTAPFTLADFIAWLETQNPAETYDFHNCEGECLIGQYMAARGREWGWSGNFGKVDPYKQSCDEVFGCQSIAALVLLPVPRTFGAALERARLAQSPQDSGHD